MIIDQSSSIGDRSLVLSLSPLKIALASHTSLAWRNTGTATLPHTFQRTELTPVSAGFLQSERPARPPPDIRVAWRPAAHVTWPLPPGQASEERGSEDAAQVASFHQECPYLNYADFRRSFSGFGMNQINVGIRVLSFPI